MVTAGLFIVGSPTSAGAQPDQAPNVFCPSDSELTIVAGYSPGWGVGAEAEGDPTPTLSEIGALPNGVLFTSTGFGHYSNPVGPAGSYPITLVASNGIEPDATCSTILTVEPAPVFTNSDVAVFTEGVTGSFDIGLDYCPDPAIDSPNLPSGLIWTSTSYCSGIISGAPGPGTAGTYRSELMDGSDDLTVQAFTLIVFGGAPAGAPDPPVGVSATGGDGSATVSWGAPSDNGSPITGYTVTDGQGVTCTPSGASCVVTGLTNGDSYTFTVTATNAGGTSGPSEQSNSVVPGETVYEDAKSEASAEAAPAGTCQQQAIGTAGDPVNCASGDFWETFTDVSVPGRGPGLDVTRTYNSLRASTEGTFGYGWTSDYDAHLSINSDGSVTLTDDDGSQVTAEPNGFGGFTVPSWADSTLAANADGTYTFVRHATQIRTFSAGGQLTAISDLNGYTTTLAYTQCPVLVDVVCSGPGVLSTATDSAGRILSFSFGSNGLVSSVTDPIGRTTSYAYDGAGDLASATDPQGRVTTFTYGANHLLLTRTDPRGGVVTNAYDAQGRVATQEDAMGRTTSFVFSGNNFSATGGTTTITDPKGHVEVEDYTNGLLTQMTKGSGTPSPATSTFTYDPFSLGITSETDPNGHVTTNTYDLRGNLLSTTDRLGRPTTYTYNAFNEVLTKTTPLGEVTTRAYDSTGNLLSSSTPLVPSSPAVAQTTSYTYGDASHPGDVTAVTDPDGGTSHIAYDTNGDLVSVADPVGDTTTFAHDGVGRPTSVVSPNGNETGGTPSASTTSYTYDAVGNVVTTTDPLGHVTTTVYDADNGPISVTDPLGHMTTTTYDADNEATVVTRADGTTLSTTYDADGNRVSTTDGAGHVTAYTYDALNRQLSMTDPLGRTTTYAYDPAGNQTSLTDPSGRVTGYAYDADDEPTGVNYSDGVTPNVAYTYDADGQRASMTDGTGTTSYTYDSLDRLNATTNGAGATVAYAYDLDGHVTGLTYPGGFTVTRAYDAAGRMTTITDWLGRIFTYTYDADGQPTATAAPNGVATTLTHDADDAITQITASNQAGPLASFAYARDADEQVIGSVESGAPQGRTNTYTYDRLGQLAGFNAQGLSVDRAGNLTTTASGAAQTFDAADEIVAQTPVGAADATSYGYDSLGERTSATPPAGQATTFAYNQAGELASFTPAPALPPTVTTTSLPAATVGGAVSDQLSATGGTGTLTFAATGLPVDGLSLSSSGLLTGTPTAATSVAFTVTVSDQNNVTSAPANLTLTVNNPAKAAPKITSAASATATAAKAFTFTVTTTGYPTPTVSASGLPTWLELTNNGNDTATLTGTPPNATTANFTLTAKNGVSPHATQAFTLTVDAVPVITTESSATGKLAVAFTTKIRTTGSPTPTLMASGLPSWLTLTDKGNGTAILSGTPTASGVFTFTITATNTAGTASQTFALTVDAAPKITSAATATATAGKAFTFTVTLTGYPTPTLSATGLPSWLKLTGTSLTGTPTKAATSKFTLTAKNGVTPNATQAFTLTVDAAAASAAVPEVFATEESAAEPAVTPTATYTYNGDGLRTSKSADGVTETFTWDVSGDLPLLLVDGATSYVYGPDGLPVEQINTNTPTYYTHDQLGSTRLLTDASGAVLASYTYDPYGNLTGTTGSATNPFGYAGQYTDAESGLIYLQARYYDPATGQFMTSDPLVAITGAAYTYVGDNPLNGTDPTGLDPTLGQTVSSWYQAASTTVTSAVQTCSTFLEQNRPAIIDKIKEEVTSMIPVVGDEINALRKHEWVNVFTSVLSGWQQWELRFYLNNFTAIGPKFEELLAQLKVKFPQPGHGWFDVPAAKKQIEDTNR
jgi:RHS repeat-associated protein